MDAPVARQPRFSEGVETPVGDVDGNRRQLLVAKIRLKTMYECLHENTAYSIRVRKDTKWLQYKVVLSKFSS